MGASEADKAQVLYGQISAVLDQMGPTKLCLPSASPNLPAFLF